MSSPFKMNPKTPFMKALVGKQGNLPEHLKQAILDAPAKMEKKKELSPNEEKAVSDYRRGSGRVDVTKKGTIVKGSESRRLGEGMGPAGTKKAGSAGVRWAGKGQPGSPKQLVVREKAASEIKAEGVKKLKTKKAAGKSPAKSYGKSPAKMTGVAGLKKKQKSKSKSTSTEKPMSKAPSAKTQAAIKRAGKKGSPVKSTGGKKKLGTEGMSYKEKVAYYEKQKKAKTAKNPKIKMGMGTSYTTIKK